MLEISKINYLKKTKRALISTAILNAPLFSLYGLTIFILRKDLKASAFHLAIITMLRPMLSFVSYFWSSYVFNREDKLKINFLWASFLSFFLFFLFPFVNSIWLVILSSSIFMLFYRAKTPAWMEIVKLNIEEKKRDQIFSYTTSIAYFIGPILAFVLGPLLEKDSLMYKNLFFIAALFALVNIWIISKVPVNLKNKNILNLKKEKLSILKPIKEGISLLRSRKDFAFFQLGYMIAGFGLMLVQPIIAIFAVDKLNVSYKEYAFAILIFKDLAFVVASPIWGKYFAKIHIMKLSAIMFFSFALFMIVLPFASYNILWFYVAFILYGIASSGSHLLWNLSGPIFAKNENSSKYTSVNVFMIAIRGCVAPAFGIFLSLFIAPAYIFFIGAMFCLFSFYLIFKKQNVFAHINKNN
ncbi:MAG: hypothetical protein KR126chlam5_00754 [Candidatus Anoxychlamydiales bacterium]|nr:hypothetical protein [Candidatus Anoxychlamydiales bacterium]